ncbi:MAG: ferrous iron transport protein B [Candidatus Thermoplasmatota archaeon]|nr:ferrous iron transport protein B [Candidatus Thermoplasmatota archaeon]MBS3790744.1 ferrous iron transport protein B [Candidatus Thermoplasmatota archaeon]
MKIRYAREALGIEEDEDVSVLIGNPNVGKSVIFSSLTGKYRDVSNYPGTTVEVSKGKTKIGTKRETIIDTPGAESLTPVSEDEKVTRDILLGTEPNQVIQVADAKNLKRSMMLLLQIAEFDIPMVLDLNMMDEAKARLVDIDIDGLKEELNIPIFPTVAPERRGTSALKRGINKARVPDIKPDYPDEIEDAIDELKDLFGSRGTALLFLAAPNEMKEFIEEKMGSEEREIAEDVLGRLYKTFSQDLSYLITLSIREKAENIFSKFVSKKEIERTTLKKKINDLTMDPWTGIPIFFGVIFLLYQFVGYIGAQVIVDFLEGIIFGEYINPYIEDLVYSSIGENFVSTILVGEYGVITVGVTWAIALILPIITTFFLAFSLLEDVGYIPRLAAMADRGLRKVGLNGKAVLPMVLGFGCDTMATLTTRVLDTKKERIIGTTMLALGIPCSAQLGVLFAIMATLPFYFFFVWAGIVSSQLLFVAWSASKILPGKRGDFIIELPPLRVPKWDNVLKKTYYRVVMFFKELVPLFILGTFLISVGKITGVLDFLIKALEPLVVTWLGLPAEASIAFILGFLRRDFGAAGLLDISVRMTNVQMLVAVVAITLFVPCVANMLVIIKERGIKTAMAIIGFIIPFAFFVAGIVNHLINLFGGLL